MRANAFVYSALLSVTAALATSSAMAQDAAQMQGPSTLSETYDAWTVRCVNTTEGERTRRACQMSQELLQQGSRQRVLLFAISKEGADIAEATLIAPFGLLLSDGLRIGVGEADLFRASFRTCLPAGCVVELELPETAIEQLSAGETATVFMTTTAGQPVQTDVSLKGFSAAYQRLVALTAG